jgi:hypothetical protein
MANAYETGNQPRLSSKRHAATPQQQHVHAAAQRGGSARTSSFNLHFISQYRTQKSYDFLHLRVINFNDKTGECNSQLPTRCRVNSSELTHSEVPSQLVCNTRVLGVLVCQISILIGFGRQYPETLQKIPAQIYAGAIRSNLIISQLWSLSLASKYMSS